MSAVTIYQVAAEAGVSIATVSKVLSNTPYVSEATRQKVLEAVERLGYVPNPAARSLTKGRTGILGLLIPYGPEQVFNDPHLMGVIYGIEKTLNERDYNLLLATARHQGDPASAYGRLMRSRYLDGAIVLETSGSERLIQQLTQLKCSWVILGYQIAPDQPAHAVHCTDRNSAQQLTEHLIGQGHRRIGVISAEPRPSAFDERLAGYRAALATHGLPYDESLLAWGDMTIDSGYAVAPKLLDRPDRPTAIFALNDRMALGLSRWALDHTVQIPADVSIVGFDDIPMAALNTPSLTTIRQPAVMLGQEATHMLFQLLDGEPVSTETQVPGELIVRDSSGPAPMG